VNANELNFPDDDNELVWCPDCEVWLPAHEARACSHYPPSPLPTLNQP
jgi:hypothetical protein